jgi:hypothetical protein
MGVICLVFCSSLEAAILHILQVNTALAPGITATLLILQVTQHGIKTLLHILQVQTALAQV